MHYLIPCQAPCASLRGNSGIPQFHLPHVNLCSLLGQYVLPFFFRRPPLNRAPSIDQDKAQLTLWEVVFIVQASACALEEYTASTEHGWYSEWTTVLGLLTLIVIYDSLHCERE